MLKHHARKHIKTFKNCSLCGKMWKTKDAFLTDDSIRLEGYQYNRLKVLAGLPPCGLLIFTHLTKNCGTSLAIRVGEFMDLQS